MTLENVLITFSRRDVLSIVGLGFVSVLLWQVPIIKIVFAPFRLFNTFIHELSHGIVAVMTGGRFERFEVNPDFSGTAYRSGGITFFVAPAGFLGAALFGGFLVLLTTASIPARVVLIGLGILLGFMSLLFVSNCFGIFMGWALAGLLFFAGWQLDDQGAASILLFLAVQMILASFESLFNLAKFPSYRKFGHSPSDAEKMQDITGIPAGSWALLWCATAIFILIWSITTAYRDMPLY
jgi:hypothetical protein